MSADEMAYLESRAEAEIALAQRANHARAVKAHYELASAYLDRLHGDMPKPGPNALTL
ncbi:MAG: hypothetical protein QOC65_1252 [Sphingomonadales bacterium]|nr:hypothetical protein [Sphingomonadales bacterium]